jgi:LysR family glycine cleavage system transcriptional activator
LVRPFELALPVTYAYWIVCPKATANLPKIVTFRDWLLSEAAEDERRLMQSKVGATRRLEA